MSVPTRAKTMSELERVSSLDLLTPTDLLLLNRLVGTDDYDYKAIFANDLYSQLATAIINQISLPPAVTIPGEDQIRDGWCVEFFEEYDVGANPTLNQGIGWDGNGVGSGLSLLNRSIYTGKSENRLVISNGQYGRKLFFGDFWNRIQIGILFRINGSATFTGDGYVGLCSGTTNMVASASTDNFVGICWSGVIDGGPNSWAFSSGTLVNKYTQSTSTRFVTRRGTTTTIQSSGAGSDGRVFSATEGYRSMLFLEFARPVFATDATSVSYSFGMRSTNATQVEMSMSKRSFVDVMLDTVASGLASNVTGSVLMGASAVTGSFNFDQSTGKFDTLNISWPHTDQTMEITAIAVRKVY